MNGGWVQRVSFHLQKGQTQANLKLIAIKRQGKLRVKKYTYKIQNSNFLSGNEKEWNWESHTSGFKSTNWVVIEGIYGFS